MLAAFEKVAAGTVPPAGAAGAVQSDRPYGRPGRTRLAALLGGPRTAARAVPRRRPRAWNTVSPPSWKSAREAC
ncbi:hypothetical protein LV779_19090 [Streptomyces thinghirensis]|nr:hypothetical protein [Streptomyces thinghirensis]